MAPVGQGGGHGPIRQCLQSCCGCSFVKSIGPVEGLVLLWKFMSFSGCPVVAVIPAHTLYILKSRQECSVPPPGQGISQWG